MRDHFSPSQFDTYLTCPRKYQYKYIDDLPEAQNPNSIDLEFGSAMHKVIEIYYKRLKEGYRATPDVLAGAFEQIFQEILRKNEKIIADNVSKIHKLTTKGIKLICAFERKFGNEIPLHIEQTLDYEINNETVTNRIDSILHLSEDLQTLVKIRDYKTSKQFFSEEEALASLQLKSYAYSVEYNYPQYKVDSVEFLVFNKSNSKLESVDVKLIEGWKEEFIQEASQIIQSVKSKLFFKNPVPKAFKCKHCPFYNTCWGNARMDLLVKKQSW